MAYVRTQHAAANQRPKWSPSGDTESNRRTLELSHEVTRAKRQNSLIRTTKLVVNSTTGAVVELSRSVKYSIPPEATAADVEALRDHGVSFETNANLVKVMNRES